jgi:hypothetical protein
METISIPVTVLTGLIGVVIGWVWSLWRAHHAHVLHSATNYATKPEVAEAIKAIKQQSAEDNKRMREAMRSCAEIAVQIARRMSIPTAVDFPENGT